MELSFIPSYNSVDDVISMEKSCNLFLSSRFTQRVSILSWWRSSFSIWKLSLKVTLVLVFYTYSFLVTVIFKIVVNVI